MMVVCKDRLETLQASRHMGLEASTTVESDIAALLSGKTYDDLTSLQRQVQNKLTSGEPVDTDYWEGLLKKLLVYKAKVVRSIIPFILKFVNHTTRSNLRVSTKLSSEIGLSSFVSVNAMRLFKHRKSYSLALLDLRLRDGTVKSLPSKLMKKRMHLLRKWKSTIGQ